MRHRGKGPSESVLSRCVPHINKRTIHEEVSPVSTSNAHINPQRRALDFDRCADAILQMAIELGDNVSRDEGRRIREQLKHSEEGAA